MVSQGERRAWASLGPALGQAFQSWGQQRARRVEFDAQMALAELERRDAKEARDEALAIDRDRLELDKERTDADIAKLEADAEYEEAQRDLNLRAERTLARMGLGKFDPTAAGKVAGEEWMGGIQEAEGGLQKIRAAVAGLAPALAKGVAAAPKESYADLAEFLREANIPQDVAGRIITMSGGAEALKPEEIDYNQMKAAFDMSIIYGVDLPAEFQAIPGVVEAITKGRERYAKAQTDADRATAIDLATAEANLKYAEWRAEHPGGIRSGPAKTGTNVFDVALGKLSDEEIDKLLKESK